LPAQHRAGLHRTDVMDKRHWLTGATLCLRGRPRGEERRVAAALRQAASSSVAGFRRSRPPFLGGGVFQRATSRADDFSACSAI
jgi:hypothetical protein